MNRRANKSKKVPNVRMRPPNPPPKRVSPEPLSSLAPDVHLESPVVNTTCPRPFKGFVLCITGILDKTPIIEPAVALGATHVSAFTDRVTHLISSQVGGAKYACAVMRKIPILKPSWVTQCFSVWQHGDDFDLDESIIRHRLPIFSDVVLCISTIPSNRRKNMLDALVENGGAYVDAIQRPVRVTHLLVGGQGEESEEKLQAEKFNATREAAIMLVWEEWFWDSIEHGGRFEEERYDIRQPPIRPFTAVAAPSPADNALLQDEASDVDELVSVQRLPAVTLELWGSLLKTRGYEIERGAVMLSPRKARDMLANGKSRNESAERNQGESVIASFRRANTVVIAPTLSATNATRMPFARSYESVEHVSIHKDGVFSGVRISLRGDTDTPKVHEAIVQVGGEIVTEGDVDYIVVRLSSGSGFYLNEPSLELQARYRTECWLEQCLSLGRICLAEEHATFVPLDTRFPIPGANKIILSLSGLEDPELSWIRRLLEALGVTLAPSFTRQSTHLICPSATGAKFEHARKWGTPVVDLGWLQAMAKEGEVPDPFPFLVGNDYVGDEDEAEPTLAAGLAYYHCHRRCAPHTSFTTLKPPFLTSYAMLEFGGRYRVEAEIAAGGCGQVFLGVHTIAGKEVAIKLEPAMAKHGSPLQQESKIYKQLMGGPGVPWILFSGRQGDYNVMVIDLLGPSLEDLFKTCNRNFSLKTVLLLADQLISRIEFCHNNNVLHRDLKPANFLMGTGRAAGVVNVVDFGLAKKYRDPQTLIHIPFSQTDYHGVGTSLFAAINTHLGIESSRRDDLESLAYMLIYFLRGTLPWRKLRAPAAPPSTYIEGSVPYNPVSATWDLIRDAKLQAEPLLTCGLPPEFDVLYRYARGLEFDDLPDYEGLRALFRGLAERLDISYDGEFDWSVPPPTKGRPAPIGPTAAKGRFCEACHRRETERR
ncbi:hypothetical protein MKEN_01010300 [Mycena kentingensis (nom. inval.)]|nr:hypothetical protein MKEN_01010300 [Mycena kentingensis (nom. inval.)]